MKITRTSIEGIEMIKRFEGFESKPYLCAAGIPTIGYGTTIYPSGKKVTLKDKPISIAQATEYLRFDLMAAERQVDGLTRDDITQRQFDALVSFVYNLGAGALRVSTLLKLVNANPTNSNITKAFMMWVNVNGKPHKAIIKRRAEEAKYYFS